MYGFCKKAIHFFILHSLQSECSSDYVIKMCDFLRRAVRRAGIFVPAFVLSFLPQRGQKESTKAENTIFSGYSGLPALQKYRDKSKVVEHSAFKSSFVANKHPCRSHNATGNFLALYLIQCLHLKKEENTA